MLFGMSAHARIPGVPVVVVEAHGLAAMKKCEARCYELASSVKCADGVMPRQNISITALLPSKWPGIRRIRALTARRYDDIMRRRRHLVDVERRARREAFSSASALRRVLILRSIPF